MSKNNTDKNEGIVTINGYVMWKYAKIVRPHIIKYLKEKFPDSLILREFNKIDLVVLKEGFPVEVQSTIVQNTTISNANMSHSQFEDRIRRQIEDNIENYEKCWFFWDVEYYRYLNEKADLFNISINLDWFAKYVKEDKLKVFVVKYDGEIKELRYEDLGFIKKLSNTCKIEYGNDDRILNRNKIKIINNVLNGYKFTQEEIDKFVEEFNNSESYDCSAYLIREKSNNRKHLYGNILHSLGNLIEINNILSMNDNYSSSGKSYGNYLGIFEIAGYGRGGSIHFVDKFNICQYFPGYLRTKDEWDRIKVFGGNYNRQQLREMFSTYHLRKAGKQSSLFDY